ncbi:GOLPH3/VPS74 family protein [Streptantibioticus ferralitis]|uniref:GPP34 family phosphoprotein n=1 Tax=Streptantibioticus ferralitis TaxID=236510 RepID=A0ABT5YWH3_9ACTN|nr:GPP34 family phosphoprotein [Streptantibioticus ferralitis]MDF2255942.1 GPP34 family phosphoprotein [Streptantibioticus ferralitis]
MQTLGDDIVLLALGREGRVRQPEYLRKIVSGSELVRLAAARRVAIVRKRIVVLDATSTGDPLLDAALVDIRTSRHAPRSVKWVARRRPHLIESYLARLSEVGVLRAERRSVLGLLSETKWFVVDTARAADARARLDAIVQSTGPVDASQTTFAGLVWAGYLHFWLYPGREGRPDRKRLRQIARRDHVARIVRAASKREP